MYHMVTRPRRLRAAPALVLCGFLAAAPLAALEPGDPGYDPLEDDRLWDEPVSPDATQTTSPELRFLEAEPERTPHHHHNQITLTAASLEDGWARLRQCHSDIAPIRRMVIVYNEERIDALRVESTANIDAARAEGDRVDLRGVGEGAEVCVTARMRIVEPEGGGIYRLENGPFKRRFLDGYFPMRVIVAVSWGDLGLALVETEPAAQPGFAVMESGHGVILDALFEGELRTLIRLRSDD